MNIIRLPLTEIKRPAKNVRIHTEKQFREFERSIRMFGQIRPIVVDEDNTILAGVGCYETLLRMGYTEADIYKIEDLTENQKKKLMIADNKIFGFGLDDHGVLDTFLQSLKDDLDIPGFDEETLKAMLSDAEAVTEKLAEYGSLTDADINDIKAAGERKREQIENASAAIPVPGSAPPPAPPPSPSDEPSEPADIKKFVLCPKCGEKVWL